MPPMKYTLDACALIALLDEEKGAEVVEGLIVKAINNEVTLFMSVINYTEVYYDRLRRSSADKVLSFLQWMDRLPITIVETTSKAVAREAARIKAHNRIPIGDAIGLATAASLDASFVTSDHSDFDAIEPKVHVPFLWIR
jgi:predicted nucleic acid-binding protein